MVQLFIGIDDGGHANHPAVKCCPPLLVMRRPWAYLNLRFCLQTEKYRARAFRIEPWDNRGIYSLDGEPVPYGPIQGSVWPKAARTMATARKSDVEGKRCDVHVDVGGYRIK